MLFAVRLVLVGPVSHPDAGVDPDADAVGQRVEFGLVVPAEPLNVIDARRAAGLQETTQSGDALGEDSVGFACFFHYL